VAPVTQLNCARIGSISALADNAAFVRSLQDQGAAVVGRCERRDHHGWRSAEIQTALQGFAAAGAAFAVTTAKDAVKLEPRNWPLPLYVLEIGLEIEDDAQLLRDVRQALKML